MTALKFKTTATCVAALVAAGAAQAEVTAQDVWDNWQQSLAIYGPDGVTVGSESVVGPSLSITDLTMTMADDATTVTSTIPSIVFTERGDGTVQVVMSESYPITLTGAPGETATLTVTQSGLEMIVSGTPEAMNYDFSAMRIAITVDEIRDRDEVVPADILMAMNTVEGSYVTEAAELTTVSYDMSVGGVDILVDVNDESTGEMVNFSGQIAGMDITGSVAMPPEMDMEAPESMFIDGFAVEGGYSFGQSAYLFSFEDGFESASGSATVGSGELSLAMDFDGISYANALTDLAITFEGGDIPFPIEASLGEYGLGFSMPLSASDVPQEFSAQFTLADLVLSDMIWSMGDPGGVLPRDPATVIVALSGAGSLFFDLLDPAQAMQIGQSDMPGAINSLTLDALTVRAAGAEVTGDGAFTFDNNDLSTFPGFPRPEGAINLAINGANALIDNLVAMGLLPEDQAMAPRMMMGVFATPVGDDMLTSTIEVNDQGHVIANGQRLQ